MRFTCVNGSRRAPNRLVVFRIPLATARTLPEPWVITVTILSASPSLIERRTTPCSLYGGIRESYLRGCHEHPRQGVMIPLRAKARRHAVVWVSRGPPRGFASCDRPLDRL